MKKLLTEFIGTFFLVLTIGCTVLQGSPDVIVPLAVGAVLMVMVYAGGHVSGAHYNPAVTLAVWFRGRIDGKDVLPYILAQGTGAALAAWIAAHVLVSPGTPMPAAGTPQFIGEMLFTFALAYVVLNVATAKTNAGNSFYGLAIGFTVIAGAFTMGHISGGAFNPAVVLGGVIMHLLNWHEVWIHLVGEFAGAALAAYVFKFVNPEDK